MTPRRRRLAAIEARLAERQHWLAEERRRVTAEVNAEYDERARRMLVEELDRRGLTGRERDETAAEMWSYWQSLSLESDAEILERCGLATKERGA